MKKLLIANRGEIAIRIARAAQDLGIETVAIYPQDDVASLHVRKADSAVELEGKGASAYLDIEQIVRVAVAADCDGVHPGYGFLSENAGFAQAVRQQGLSFVGPETDALTVFGDKAKARALAEQLGVPVLAGLSHAVSEDEARDFFAEHSGSGIIIKAIAGGGGRGMRVVRQVDELAEAYARAASEANAAFGSPAVYAEQFVGNARHVEVQILGDGSGAVSAVETASR